MRLSYMTDANNNKSFNLPAEAIEIINANRKRFSIRAVEKDLTPFNILNLLRQILKMCDYSEKRVKEETENGMKTTFDFGAIEKDEFVEAFNENRDSYALNELCLDNAEDAWTVLILVSEN